MILNLIAWVVNLYLQTNTVIKRKLMILIGNSIKLLWFKPSTQEWTTDEIPSRYEDEKVMNTFGMLLVKVILPKYGSFNLQALNVARYRLFRALIYNGLNISEYEMDYNDDERMITVTKIDNISENTEIGNEEDIESAYSEMLLPYADLVDKLSDSYQIATDPKLKKLYGYLHDEILDASMNKDADKINQIMKKYGKFLPTNLNEEKKDPPIGNQNVEVQEVKNTTFTYVTLKLKTLKKYRLETQVD